MMNKLLGISPGFRHRCEAALTHPVTVSALVVLLLNDMLFKSLWPNPWTTGKLSDLAWVVFASPLLAFLLSLITRGNRLAQRGAFAVAYAGLPLLYAVFNTFQPVHDAILSVLLLASGKDTGSPLDPADSLVIPVGLSAAIWVWRRPLAGRSSVRMRLGLLTAAVAALASVATSEPAPSHGITFVGMSGDLTVAATSEYVRTYWISSDGGLTWISQKGDKIEHGSVVGGERRTETPRGTYRIDGTRIVRGFGGEHEIVYSAAYLREESNRWAQAHDTMEIRRIDDSPITTSLWSIAYDDLSGNVIVAMGFQGVVVGTVDGRWTRVAVGPYSPTDFSLSGKLRRLVTVQGLVAALTLSLSFGLAAVVLSERTACKDIPKIIKAYAISILSIPPAFAIAVLILNQVVAWLDGFLPIPDVPETAQWIWFSASSAVFIAMVGLGVGRAVGDRQSTVLKGLVLATATWTAILSFPVLPPNAPSTDLVMPTLEESLAVLVLPALALLLATSAQFWLLGRHWLAVVAALAGMYLLIALVLVLWVQSNLLMIVAKSSIAALLTLAALVLLGYLKRGRRCSSVDESSTGIQH